MSVVLHEFAKACRNGTVPSATRPSSLRNDRPPTLIVAGQSTAVSGVVPSIRAAVAVTTLKTEPGA